MSDICLNLPDRPIGQVLLTIILMSDIGQANDNITVWFTVLCVTYGYYM